MTLGRQTYTFETGMIKTEALATTGSKVTMSSCVIWVITQAAVLRQAEHSFIYADLSIKRLKVTPRVLRRLLSFHQVMSRFIDFLSVFGRPPQSRELGFSGFYQQTNITPSLAAAQPNAQQQQQQQQQATVNMSQNFPSMMASRPTAVTNLGRSGSQIQMCYNLKRVARTRGTPEDSFQKQKWSIQQNEFHHQLDIVEGNALWINAKGRLDDYRNDVLDMTGGLSGQPKELTFCTRAECFRSSLTVHLMNCYWACNDWRGYVIYLEQAVEETTRPIVIGPWFTEELTLETLQNVQNYEEKSNLAGMIIETNIEVMAALRNYYRELGLDKNFDMKSECDETMVAFVQQMTELIHTFEVQRRRLRLLVETTENRKTLVRLLRSSLLAVIAHIIKLLQKLQSRATKNMEEITTMSYQEAVTMKIITVGTFVFLPATFVSVSFPFPHARAED
ncbi:hypothetical protein K491DRAFT_755154 [Lophiostoma macrostomum CBS 122681]|uniref:CorA-like transporter domain-containing protein n=1 Tax=Lophiostoma macrostomum CBS 122681 TaxID=1314788 RepID=A0A6A6TI69_9PLEO|nr:hypothetical protein K491DRAFT_755154 [Lophiostoma macrostomum CBS 122681]